jgi:hypothetical protein
MGAGLPQILGAHIRPSRALNGGDGMLRFNVFPARFSLTLVPCLFSIPYFSFWEWEYLLCATVF